MILRPRLRPTALRKPHPTTKRTLIAPPKPGSGPLMQRLPNRALPPLAASSTSKWLKTIPLFAAIMLGSFLAIVNYQKQSSSVVNSTMYALRTNTLAREVLGDEIYFASQMPWISGELNQLHGRIDIRFWVKGSRGKALMRFRSERRGRMGFFETVEWSLQPEGRDRPISLIQGEEDPFLAEAVEQVAVAA